MRQCGPPPSHGILRQRFHGLSKGNESLADLGLQERRNGAFDLFLHRLLVSTGVIQLFVEFLGVVRSQFLEDYVYCALQLGTRAVDDLAAHSHQAGVEL